MTYTQQSALAGTAVQLFYSNASQSVEDNRSYNTMDLSIVKEITYNTLTCEHPSLKVTVHGKILVGEKLANLANRKPSAKIFLANIHRYTENV